MGKILKCRDLGSDCDEVIRGGSTLEILIKAAQHAAQRHPDVKITSELQAKAKASIKGEDPSARA